MSTRRPTWLLSWWLTSPEDSPAGLLAWIREKYHEWSDEYPWTNDEVLMWTMLYWIPGPTASFRYVYVSPSQVCYRPHSLWQVLQREFRQRSRKEGHGCNSEALVSHSPGRIDLQRGRVSATRRVSVTEFSFASSLSLAYLDRRWGNMVQPLKYVKRHDKGGHFGAWETYVPSTYLVLSSSAFQTVIS